MQVKEPIDVFLSHDWPVGVVPYGNAAELLKKKPYFRDEVQRGDLGSPANWQLLQARACAVALKLISGNRTKSANVDVRNGPVPQVTSRCAIRSALQRCD